MDARLSQLGREINPWSGKKDPHKPHSQKKKKKRMFNMLKEIGGLKSKRKEQKMLQYKIGLKKNQIEHRESLKKLNSI